MTELTEKERADAQRKQISVEAGKCSALAFGENTGLGRVQFIVAAMLDALTEEQRLRVFRALESTAGQL